MIAGLGEELHSGLANLQGEAGPETPAYSIFRYPAEHLVRRHQGVEEVTEEGIEDKYRNKRRTGELDCAAIVSNTSRHIRHDFANSAESKLGIHRDRLQMRIAIWNLCFVQDSSAHTEAVYA